MLFGKIFSDTPSPLPTHTSENRDNSEIPKGNFENTSVIQTSALIFNIFIYQGDRFVITGKEAILVPQFLNFFQLF